MPIANRYMHVRPLPMYLKRTCTSFHAHTGHRNLFQREKKGMMKSTLKA